jgi:hypothetical protein
MTTTPQHKSRRMLLAFPAALVVAAALAPSTFAATPISGGSAQPGPYIAPAPSTSTQIIMRDGGICDPIRHIGC